MGKPSKSAKRVASPAHSSTVMQTTGVQKAGLRSRQRRQSQLGLKQWGRRRWKKLAAGSTEAGGGQESGQGQSQGRVPRAPGMEEGQEEARLELEQFLNTGRTGRRNAMPEITQPGLAALSTAHLPLNMAKLSCAEPGRADSSGLTAKGSKQDGHQGS